MCVIILLLFFIDYVCYYTQKHNINLGHTLNACVLCLRFPFLYPRNRFTGKHYNYWPFLEWRNKKYKEAYDFLYKDDHFKKVVKSYYWAFVVTVCDFINNYVLPLFHFIPTYSELDGMDDGWRKAFGIQMCKELRSQLIKDRMLFSFRITDLKEKYGTLRLYGNHYSEEVFRIINKYEAISRDVCGVCGKPADYITLDYIYPYCKDCFKPISDLHSHYMRRKGDDWEEVELLKEEDRNDQ